MITRAMTNYKECVDYTCELLLNNDIYPLNCDDLGDIDFDARFSPSILEVDNTDCVPVIENNTLIKKRVLFEPTDQRKKKFISIIKPINSNIIPPEISHKKHIQVARPAQCHMLVERPAQRNMLVARPAQRHMLEFYIPGKNYNIIKECSKQIALISILFCSMIIENNDNTVLRLQNIKDTRGLGNILKEKDLKKIYKWNPCTYAFAISSIAHKLMGGAGEHIMLKNWTKTLNEVFDTAIQNNCFDSNQYQI